MSSPILNSLVIKARHVSSISPKKSSLLFRHGFESSNSAGYQASIESEYLSGDNNKTRLAFKTYGGGSTTNTDDVKMTISETGVVNIYGSLDMNGGKISNLGTPVSAGDATTKSYVDGSVSGLVSSQWTTSGSNIFYTTGNVGIGTNNPSGNVLYVNSLTNTSVARFQGSHSALLFKTSATTSGYTGTLEINDVGVYLGHDSASRAIIFNQQTNERLRIHTNGNVGIGTNNPLQLLHVNGTARIQKVVNLDAPVDAGDATNKGYVDGAIGTLTTNVGKLDTSMGLVEGAIGTLTTNVGKLDTSMGLVEGAIGTLTTNVGKLDTSMGLVEGAIGTLTTNVGKLDTSMGLVEGAIGTLTTNVGKLDTSMGLVVFQQNGVLLSDLSANGFKIKSLADPTENQDAATKKYVDDNIGGGSSIPPMVTNWTLVLTHFTVGNGSATGYYQVIGNLCVAQFKIIVGDGWGVTQLTDSLYIDTPLPVYSNTPDDIVVGQINMKIKNSTIPVNGNLIRKSFGNGQKLLITVNKQATDGIGFNYIGNYELNGVTYTDLTAELDYITGTFSYMIQI